MDVSRPGARLEPGQPALIGDRLDGGLVRPGQLLHSWRHAPRTEARRIVPLGSREARKLDKDRVPRISHCPALHPSAE